MQLRVLLFHDIVLCESATAKGRAVLTDYLHVECEIDNYNGGSYT